MAATSRPARSGPADHDPGLLRLVRPMLAVPGELPSAADDAQWGYELKCSWTPAMNLGNSSNWVHWLDPVRTGTATSMASMMSDMPMPVPVGSLGTRRCQDDRVPVVSWRQLVAGRWAAALPVACALAGCALAGCTDGGSRVAAPAGSATVGPTATATRPAPATGAVSASPGPSRIGTATAAPSWLGTRVLPVGPDGFAAARQTPPELRRRSIITRDELPPPADGKFHASIGPVPPAVLARSSWTSRCPITAAQLRYLTVVFRGFDGRAHTGELLVNARVARPVVTVFARLFAAGFPIERMRITSAAELSAAPTGDDNTTGAFACRPVRGQKAWSEHAYGLAIDVDPFQNPYRRGTVVLPELAAAYLDRADSRPGMILPAGPVVRAFAAIGWTWGGDYRSLKDYMHFSIHGG
jgi:hypothetical protein